jgi:hypothetical protein
MPPKAEVRHNLLVTLFLDKLEEEYDNTGALPNSWWSDDEARYLLRNYRQHNFTLEERDRASAEAIDQFYAGGGETPIDEIVNIVTGIVADISQNVGVLVYRGPGAGQEHRDGRGA